MITAEQINNRIERIDLGIIEYHQSITNSINDGSRIATSDVAWLHRLVSRKEMLLELLADATQGSE